VARSGVTTESRHGRKVADLVAVSVAIPYVGTVAEGEIYPNAPVVLVAFEVRHPTAPRLSPARQQRIKQRLGATAPILRSGKLTNIEGAIGATEEPTLRVEEFPRLLSRDSTLSVSFREGSIVIETTRYGGWERFRKLIDDVLHARLEVGDLDGVERVGLRYIDELRVPDQTDSNWQHWVDASLLGPTQIGEKLGLQPTQWQGITIFTPGTDRTVALRYGPREGYAVDPGGELRRPAPAPGPFFLLDIDSFWMPSDGVPEFDVDELLPIAEDLHTPVRKLFESLITEELREEVLRRAD
jgi:uncharacterized protein (TIGR04255 family)